MADDNIRHVNCASDFRIVFAFSDGKLPDYPWRLGLKTPNTPSYNMYVASFDGTTYNNCSPLDDESIMVFVDHHRLAPGILHYYLQTDAPDSLFPDGEMNITIPGTVNIELWEGPSDGDTPPEVTVIVERLLKGDKGDPGEAGPAGPEGPVGPKGDTPEITADEQGNIYSDGELLTSVVAEAATKANAAAEHAENAVPVIEEIEGAAVTIDVQPNHIYKCGELTSLTIQSVVDSAQIAEVIFTSGVAATELALPDTLSGVTGWQIPQPNKTYKIFFQSNTATISD
jgi:hypothetical protein